MRKIIQQNLTITFTARVLSFAMSILAARYLSVNEFAIYLAVILTCSYAPYFQLGMMSGFNILMPKIIRQGGVLAPAFLSIFSYMNIVLMLPFFLMVISFDLIKINQWVTIAIFLSIVLQKLTENIVMLMQVEMQFEELNKLKIFSELIPLLLAIICLFVFRTKESIFLATAASSVIAILVAYKKRPISLLIDFSKIKDCMSYFRELFQVGVPLYFIWLMDFGLRSLDRIFISIFYTPYEFASYGFAAGVAFAQWMLTLSFLAPYVQILLSKVSEKSWTEVRKHMIDTNQKVQYFILTTICVSLVAYPLLTRFVVHKYDHEVLQFFLLLISTSILSMSNLYIYYLSATRQFGIMIRSQLLITIFNIICNGLISCWRLDVKLMILSSILNLAVYYLILRYYATRDIVSRQNSVVSEINKEVSTYRLGFE